MLSTKNQMSLKMKIHEINLVKNGEPIAIGYSHDSDKALIIAVNINMALRQLGISNLTAIVYDQNFQRDDIPDLDTKLILHDIYQ